MERMHKLCRTTLASLFLLAPLSEADAKPSFQKGKGSCSVVEYLFASSQGSGSCILPNPRPFSVGKSELEVSVSNTVSAYSCNTTKTGAVLFMLGSGPGTHNTISEAENLTAAPHAISDTANKFTVIRRGCCHSSTPKGYGNIKSLMPEAVSNGNITVAATFIFGFVMGLGATASESRLICPPVAVVKISTTRQNVVFADKLERHGGFSLSTTDQEYNYHRKTGRGYIPLPQISVFPVKLTLGLGFLCLFLMFGISGVYSSVKKHKFINLKAKFFQKNGGVLIEQHISSHGTDGSPKIFTSEELKVAADYYNQIHTFSSVESGTVYKGLLPNGATVAITETVLQGGQIGRFVNEIVTLTKINHENVVKFLGCCLETEAPMLVYELACNGTLFDYIHHVNGKKALPWHILLKIASESAVALAYLHSAADSSKPMIIHGNVNSSNILLSNCFVAKVSGFGSSRLVRVPSNESQMKTLLQQTVGYLDPEYLHTGQLTDKSDVYSFGVVLLELLTGEMPLSFNRPENRRIITSHFVSSVGQNDIFQILMPQLVNEGNKEQVRAVAELAKSCLKLSSAERPAMEEVAGELRRLCGSTHSS